MTWKRIFTGSLTSDWLFTMPVEGEYFRVKQTFSSLPPWGFWGYIGQAGGTFTPSNELANVRRLYPTVDAQVIRFIAPDCWAEDRAIAIKGFSKRKFSALGFQISTTVDVWEAVPNSN